jgi:hypothetical protein
MRFFFLWLGPWLLTTDTWFNLKGGFRIEVAVTTGSGDELGGGASATNMELG